MKKSRSNYSVLNALTAAIYTLVYGLVSLVATRCILVAYGSDFNGLSATATQIVNILLIFESGVTVATNVALFDPIRRADRDAIETILSTAKRAYILIGACYIAIGIVISIIFANLAKSDISVEYIFCIILMAILPSGLNLLLSTKYSVMICSEQKEYLLNIAKMITMTLGQIAIIILAVNQSNILLVRMALFCASVANCISIVAIARVQHSDIHYNKKPDFRLLKGTKDICMQKIAGVVIGTTPAILISILNNTMLTSVYSIYLNIITMIKSFMLAIINAPRMSIGNMLTEGNQSKINTVFLKYEMIVFLIITPVAMTYCALVMPFVSIYTRSVNDIEYHNLFIAAVLILDLYVNCIHMPSGIMMNMAGRFRESKVIQARALVIFIACAALGFMLSGIYGLISAVLISTIVTAIGEVNYVHCSCFHCLGKFVRMLVPSMLAFIFTSVGFYAVGFSATGYLQLVLYAVVLFAINSAVSCALQFVFCRELFTSTVRWVIHSIQKAKGSIKDDIF